MIVNRGPMNQARPTRVVLYSRGEHGQTTYLCNNFCFSRLTTIINLISFSCPIKGLIVSTEDLIVSLIGLLAPRQ